MKTSDILRFYRRLISSPRHLKFLGMTGTGKSNFMLCLALAWAILEEVGLACFFPHRKEGEKLLVWLDYLGLLDRTAVDDLDDPTRVLPKRLIRVSAARCDFVRREENELARDTFIELVARRRPKMEDIADTPCIEKYSKLAVSVYQYLDEWLPLYLLPKVLVKGHEVQRWALSHVTDEEVREELDRAAAMNPHDQVAMLMPAERFLDGFLGGALMRARTSVPPRFGLPAHLKDCGLGVPGIYIALGGGSEESVRTNMGSDFQNIALDARANRSRVVRQVLVDEAANYKLLGNFESKALSTLRGFNVLTGWAIQSYDFGTPEQRSNFRQNTDTVAFSCNSFEMATEAAKDLCRELDEYRVHHTDKVAKSVPKQVFGKKTAESQRYGDDGKVSNTKTVSTDSWTEYGEMVEERPVYQAGPEQLFWLAQSIQEQATGVCRVHLRHHKPWKGLVPLLPDLYDNEAFDDDLTEYEEEVQRCLSEVKQAAFYAAPRTFNLPQEQRRPTPPPPPPPRREPKAPTPNPRGRGKPGRKG